jgi:hypothetical protein
MEEASEHNRGGTGERRWLWDRPPPAGYALSGVPQPQNGLALTEVASRGSGTQHLHPALLAPCRSILLRPLHTAPPPPPKVYTDFMLVFTNSRQYNPPGSDVYYMSTVLQVHMHEECAPVGA